MSKCKAYLTSSIGKKQVVALTGLGLSGFVLMHMSGNLFLFLGPEMYNLYAHKMITNPLLYPAEIGLVLLFVIHLSMALKLAYENRVARGVKPSQLPSSCEKRASFASRTMVLTGLLILTFAVLHLKDFKYGDYYTVTYDGVEMRDLYKLVAEEFSETGHVAFYCFSMVVLFLHLSHGIAGAFQSLGAASVRNQRLKKIAIGFAILVAGGFISQPLVFYFRGGM